jgi:hypothetical protein
MKTSYTLIVAFCGILFCLTVSTANRPNIVFIMADDLGNADVRYHCGQIKMPNIDKLAGDGIAWSPSTASSHSPRESVRRRLFKLEYFYGQNS